jgi:GxxExxY protein
MDENRICSCIVDTAVRIHRETEPGLFETVYETILAHQLRENGIEVKRQVTIAIEYSGVRFKAGFRADLIIENKVIVELKCVEKLNNAHRKQLLTYLRLTGMRLGYLLSFGESLMKNGNHRTVNGLAD